MFSYLLFMICMDDNTAVSILRATHIGASLHAVIGKVGLILTDGIVLKDRLPLGDKGSTDNKDGAALELASVDLHPPGMGAPPSVKPLLLPSVDVIPGLVSAPLVGTLLIDASVLDDGLSNITRGKIN